jgi:hypothetical protein
MSAIRDGAGIYWRREEGPAASGDSACSTHNDPLLMSTAPAVSTDEIPR